jgi:Fe2+ or Zn2+ uptake regulation protein
MLGVENATARLREAGLRLTPQRRALLEELAGDTSHPSAESIAERVSRRVPGVSVSTVYKGLHELSSLGLIQELDLPGALRFDPETDHHAHFLCDVCTAVTDVELDAALIERLMAATGDVTPSRVDVLFHGTCPACSNLQESPLNRH